MQVGVALDHHGGLHRDFVVIAPSPLAGVLESHSLATVFAYLMNRWYDPMRCLLGAVIQVRPLGYELRTRGFRMSVQSQKRRSTPFGCLARCATSHRFRPISPRFVPNFVPK